MFDDVGKAIPCVLIGIAIVYMARIILREQMEEAILDSIYYDLYSAPSAFPEIETITLKNSKNNTYTINKDVIYLNLDSFIADHSLETFNYLIFKAAHELAHAKCTQIGHTDNFKEIFTTILGELATQGKYSDELRKTYETKKYGPIKN
jgi:hypothetical protein